jgi:hypothetical protein
MSEAKRRRWPVVRSLQWWRERHGGTILARLSGVTYFAEPGGPSVPRPDPAPRQPPWHDELETVRTELLATRATLARTQREVTGVRAAMARRARVAPPIPISGTILRPVKQESGLRTYETRPPRGYEVDADLDLIYEIINAGVGAMGGFYYSATPPSPPVNGTAWANPEGDLFVYDASAAVWIQLAAMSW